MLEIRDLCFRYGKNEVLRGVELTLADGQIGILLGRNGSGKTTLFRNILGLAKPSGGSILLDGKDVLKMSGRERAGLIAFVPQHIHFGDLTVLDSILMGRISRFGMRAGREDYEIVRSIMAQMQLEDYSNRSAEALSGGEKQKIAIARALAQEPRLLVFDEPTGNLDMANGELIIAEAKKLAKERNISVLSSLHDLNQALRFGDRFYFLKNGTIRYSGAQEIVNAPLIREIFDVPARIAELDGKKIVLEGSYYEE